MTRFLALILLFTSTFSYAIDIDEQLRSALKSFTDRTKYKVIGVSRTPTPGLFVLLTDNGIQLTNYEGKLLYSRDIAYSADKRGEIIGSSLNDIRLEALSEIDTNSIIVVDGGKINNKVIVSSAIDCPYCVEQEKLISGSTINTTLYLIPSVLEKENWPILEKIMCSDDRAKSWKIYMLHKVVPKNSGRCYWSENHSFSGISAYTSQVLKTVGTPQMVYADGSIQSFSIEKPLGDFLNLKEGQTNIFNGFTAETSYFSRSVYTSEKKRFLGLQW